MKHTLNAEDYQVLISWLENEGFSRLLEQMKPENVMVSGITVTELWDSPDYGKVFDYTEDGLTAENGYPYLLSCNYSGEYGELVPGSRLIALYVNRAHFILPGDQVLLSLAPSDPADRTECFDKSKMYRIPRIEILDLPREEQRLLTEEERALIEMHMSSRQRKGSKAVGTVCVGLLWFIFVGIIFLIVVNTFEIRSPAGIIVSAAAAVLLICGGSIGSMKLLSTGSYTSRLNYIKPVYIWYYRKPTIKETGQIDTWEWTEGKFCKLQHIIVQNQVYFDENTAEGSIVFRVSTKEITGSETYSGHYFAPELLSPVSRSGRQG